MRHRVLYMRSAPGGEFAALCSCAEGDPETESDFVSHKAEQITLARNAGAVRPEFKTVDEEDGKPIAAKPAAAKKEEEKK